MVGMQLFRCDYELDDICTVNMIDKTNSLGIEFKISVNLIVIIKSKALHSVYS